MTTEEQHPGYWLNLAMDAQRLSVAELAEDRGVSVQSVYKWLKTGQIAREHLPGIAARLKTSVDYLLTGTMMTHEEFLAAHGEYTKAVYGDAQAGPRIRGNVPLISWVQAGNWGDSGDDKFEPEAWYPCPKKHGARTFCLRVVGISNTNPNGRPSLNDGDIIFVDPDAEPMPNTHSIQSCVVVRRPTAAGIESTVKQLVQDNGRLYLKALNPAWPEPIIELTKECRICGTVIGKWVE